jgi:hypothetical protein
MMEAVQTSETSVKSYQPTQCYNAEGSHLHTHRRENLKSYLICNSDGIQSGATRIQVVDFVARTTRITIVASCRLKEIDSRLQYIGTD